MTLRLHLKAQGQLEMCDSMFTLIHTYRCQGCFAATPIASWASRKKGVISRSYGVVRSFIQFRSETKGTASSHVVLMLSTVHRSGTRWCPNLSRFWSTDSLGSLVYDKYGPPASVLTLQQKELPALQPHQVLVDFLAVGHSHNQPYEASHASAVTSLKDIDVSSRKPSGTYQSFRY